MTPVDGEYNPGSGFENYIDIPGRDFRVYFFDQQNRYIDSLDITSVIPTDSGWETSGESKHYGVLGKTTTDISRLNAKVMILANWRGVYPTNLVKGVSTIDNLCTSPDAVYEFSPEQMALSRENTIPLYGIKDLGVFTWGEDGRGNDHFYSMGNIHMLRAYAKVEVINNSESRLTEVKLHRYNRRGYKAPFQVYRESDYVHNSWSQDYVATPHIPAGNAFSAEVFSFLTPEQSSTNWIVYVPEYDNLTTPEVSSYMTVKFDDSDKEYTIEFRSDQNNAGTEFSLLRNNWYRFTLDHTTLEGLKVRIFVRKWNFLDHEEIVM
ncbi:MAG: hypothetical protein NC336_07455 [Clostridium sp.]|nr:hypothetical protein [Clostridium sp.]